MKNLEIKKLLSVSDIAKNKSLKDIVSSKEWVEFYNILKEGDLNKILNKQIPGHETADVEDLFRQVCFGVRALNDLHMVHGDIKADNVGLRRNTETEELTAVLIDIDGIKQYTAGDFNARVELRPR